MVYRECADGAGSSSETEKIFRGAFGLMKFFAERKCPGARGERGLRGCRGAVGGGTEGDVRELIAKRVCVEYAETAWGIQGEFWDVVARAEHGSDSFVGCQRGSCPEPWCAPAAMRQRKLRRAPRAWCPCPSRATTRARSYPRPTPSAFPRGVLRSRRFSMAQ
jgi:hypothetical protein